MKKSAGMLITLLMITSLALAASQEPRHPLSHINPTDTDFNMSGYQIFNSSSFELQDGLNFSGNSIYDQGNIRLLQWDTDNREWDVRNADFNLNSNSIINPGLLSMQGNIDMNGFNITEIDTLSFLTGMRINGSIKMSGGNIDLDNGSIKDVYSINGGGNSVNFLDSIDMNEYDISGVDQITIPDNGDSSGKNLLQIGDDVYFTDIDSSNTLGIQGIGENAVGNIKLGSAGPTLSGTSSGNLDLNGNLNVNNQLTVGSTVCNTGQYIDGDGSCTSVTGETSGEYVNEAGDTMTGDLNMQGNSVQNVGILNASTIQIDGNDIGGLFVDESGDSMSGNLNMQNHHIDNLAHLELNSGSGGRYTS